jgi:hypothetical protein
MNSVIENLNRFASKHGLILEQEGEVGFGRECVGFTKSGNYVDYNPTDSNTYEEIEEFYDERLNDLTTYNAYHKHNCLSVLGRGDEALNELNEWITNLENAGEIEVASYKTGATGLQAMFSGVIGYAVRFKRP